MALLAAAFSDESANPSAIRAKMPATVSVFVAYNIETLRHDGPFDGEYRTRSVLSGRRLTMDSGQRGLLSEG